MAGKLKICTCSLYKDKSKNAWIPLTALCFMGSMEMYKNGGVERRGVFLLLWSELRSLERHEESTDTRTSSDLIF